MKKCMFTFYVGFVFGLSLLAVIIVVGLVGFGVGFMIARRLVNICDNINIYKGPELFIRYILI